VLGKPYAHRVNPLPLAALTMTGGAIPLLFIALPSMMTTNWAALPTGVWLALIYASVGALVVAYLFWHRGVRVLGPTRAAMYGNLQPIIALAFAWVMLGEAPTVVQTAGAASIIYGLLLTRG
jgi:drug/metabolite transporter (DMT)-like permease